MLAFLEEMRLTRANPLIPYYVRALAMGIPAYLIGVHLWSWVFMAPFYLGGHSDFRQIYTASWMLRTGQANRLYDPVAQEQAQNSLVGIDQIIPFVRPAYELLLFLPLTFFRYRIAYLMMLAVNLFLLVLIYWLMRPKMRNLAKIFAWLPAALFLAFLPIAGALIQGQDSILLLLLFTAALLFMDKGENVMGGFILGLGMFKLQLTVPLVLIFFLWRRWDFCRGVLLSAIPAALISLWIMGLGQLKTYIRVLLFMGQASPVAKVLPVDHMTNLHGLVFGLLGARLPAGWIAAITAMLSVALLLYLATLKPSGPDALLIALIGSVLLSYYLFFHDVSVLFLPVSIALDRFLLGRWDPDNKKIVILACALFVFPLLLSYAPPFLYLMAIPLICLLTMWKSSSVPAVALGSQTIAVSGLLDN